MNDRNDPLEIAYMRDFSCMTNVRGRWWRTLDDCGNKVCMISSAMMNTICCGGFHNKNNDRANDNSNDGTNRNPRPCCDENRKQNKFGKCGALFTAIIGCIPLDEHPRMLYGLNVLGLATYWATADSAKERFDEAKMERKEMRKDMADMRKEMNEKLDGVLELLKQRNS